MHESASLSLVCIQDLTVKPASWYNGTMRLIYTSDGEYIDYKFDTKIWFHTTYVWRTLSRSIAWN